MHKWDKKDSDNAFVKPTMQVCTDDNVLIRESRALRAKSVSSRETAVDTARFQNIVLNVNIRIVLSLAMLYEV